MLKTIVSSQMLITNKIFAANEIGGIKGDNKLIEKYEKLSKSWKLTKSERKLLKSGNLFNFDIKKNGSSFLIPNTRMAFNCLRLAFIKATIL